jgi:hypothetical protein
MHIASARFRSPLARWCRTRWQPSLIWINAWPGDERKGVVIALLSGSRGCPRPGPLSSKQPGRRHQRSSSSIETRSRNMRSHLYGAIAIAAMIAPPAMAQTTTPTSNTMSTPGPGAGTSTPTLSHDGSSSLTNSNASRGGNSPGAGASPHTGFSSGMTPSAGTASGTADGTTDTGATSPGSGKSAAPR